MRYSGIGGQAVMEGVMMRNGDKYAVAVRKPDHEIEVAVKDCKSICADRWKKVPLVRGVICFIESLVLGMSTLMYSASFFEDESDAKKETNKQKENSARDEKKEKALMGGTVAFSVILAIAIFMILPYYLSQLFQRFVTDNGNLVAIFEGVLRLVIFIGYIVLISRMKDIQRVFMYHGAEHKCINCIESGLELNVENVRKSSREHKRCGTSFLVFVVVITIIFYLFIRADSHLMKLVIRLLLIPVIAGISYELLRAAGRSDHPVINFLSKPGMWMQKLTVREPDDEMIEVGIASVEAVFDWKKYLEELRQQDDDYL